MRFPEPVARTCVRCGQPTVVAETAIASVRVHCGTWRWQCDTPAKHDKREARAVLPPAPPGVDGDADLAA
ncbi:MAG TPA: hypothetical protein VHH34_09565 [Pseudonocardiaceae bacterium]|nr:hypothetical protein [Pseudonocardiaceae bacterium]